MVHRNIVCRTSDYFCTALKDTWQKGDDKYPKLSLPESDPDIFSIYLGWLYTKTVDVKEDSDTRYTAEMNHSVALQIEENIFNSYVLGDYLGDRPFCNALIDEAIKLAEGIELLISTTLIESACKKLPVDSTYVKLCADYYATDYGKAKFEEEAKKMPAEFVLKIATTSVWERDMSNIDRKPRNRPKCYYHNHRDESDKCQ